MSLNAATIATLIAKGLSAEDILDVARATEVKADPTNAERQARYRARKRNAVTVTESPPNEVSSNPEKVTTGAKAPSVTSERVKPHPFPCPPRVDPAHWRDFLANRKRKGLVRTETAYQGILADIHRIADDDWPPGRLVQHAAAKGWGSINDPRETRNGHRSEPSRPAAAYRDPILGDAIEEHRAGLGRSGHA